MKTLLLAVLSAFWVGQYVEGFKYSKPKASVTDTTTVAPAVTTTTTVAPTVTTTTTVAPTVTTTTTVAPTVTTTTTVAPTTTTTTSTTTTTTKATITTTTDGAPTTTTTDATKKDDKKPTKVEELSEQLQDLGAEMACHYVANPSVYHKDYGCFVLHEKPETWERAFTNCLKMKLRQQRGRLAHIRTTPVMKAVAERIKQFKKASNLQHHQLHFWVGVRRDWALMHGGDDKSDENDSWFYYYTNTTQKLELGSNAPWDHEEPFSQTNEREDCANLRVTVDEASFGSDPCRMELPYVCQYFGPSIDEDKSKRGFKSD